MPLYGPAATVGDQVLVLIQHQLHVYDASDDDWSVREPPPGPSDDRWSLTAADGRVIALRQTQRTGFSNDQVLDPSTGRWTALPADPLVPTTSTWAELPGSDQLQGLFTWTGARLVDAEIFVADGGQVQPYDRAVPSGGTLTLPDGDWGRLSDPPQLGTGGWRVQVRAGRYTAIEGYLYDLAEQRWTRVPQPEGSADRPGSAVWADDRLIVLGGLTDDDDDPDAGLSRQAYELQP